MREQKEKGQAPVSDHSRCFSDKGGTVKLFAMKSHGDKISCQHIQFFYRKYCKQVLDSRNCSNQAEDHGTEREFIRNRIQGFSQLGHLMKLPCCDPVKKVGDAG